MAVRGEPRHLQRFAVVTVPRHRSTDDDNTNEFAIRNCADTELVPDRRRMVAMKPSHEVCRLAECERAESQQSAIPRSGAAPVFPGRDSGIFPVRSAITAMKSVGFPRFSALGLVFGRQGPER